MPSLKKIFKDKESAATEKDIRGIVGPLDETLIVAIMRTGASPDEVLQALEWLEEDYYTKTVFVRRMDDTIRRIYDILYYAHNGFGESIRRH